MSSRILRLARVLFLPGALVAVILLGTQLRLPHLAEIEGGVELFVLVYAVIAAGIILHERVVKASEIRRYGSEAVEQGTAEYVPWSDSDYLAQPDGSIAVHVYRPLQPAVKRPDRPTREWEPVSARN